MLKDLALSPDERFENYLYGIEDEIAKAAKAYRNEIEEAFDDLRRRIDAALRRQRE